MFKSDTVDSIKRFLDFSSRAVVALLVMSINDCQKDFEKDHANAMNRFADKFVHTKKPKNLMDYLTNELEKIIKPLSKMLIWWIGADYSQ